MAHCSASAKCSNLINVISLYLSVMTVKIVLISDEFAR